MQTFYIENFGCRASQADGAALESLLEHRGLKLTTLRSQADLIILNTCTVTSGADADVRAAVRKSHRENPSSRILITGCYAQRAPEELYHLPGVEWVVGNARKSEIPQIIEETVRPGSDREAIDYHGGVFTADVMQSRDFLTAPVIESATDRARPNLKIQDGCPNRCSFCVIPFVRGNNRFLPADEVVSKVGKLAETYREVVLTGINLGRWGRESGSSLRLPQLLQRLLDETAIGRIRLSSVEPMDWSEELLALMAESPRIAPHVHMPLQSGADRILKAMRRKYRTRHYADRIWKAHRLMPDAALGADVMTGFPGETDELFEESRAFIESLPFSYLHVFTYSERPGTAAANMPGSAPVSVRRERTGILRALSERCEREFQNRMLHKTFPAVTLEQAPFALTENYLKVAMHVWPGPNQMVEVMIGSSRQGRSVEEWTPLRVLGGA